MYVQGNVVALNRMRLKSWSVILKKWSKVEKSATKCSLLTLLFNLLYFVLGNAAVDYETDLVATMVRVVDLFENFEVDYYYKNVEVD